MKKKKYEQDILITESRLFNLIEITSFFLHIAILVLGLFALIEFFHKTVESISLVLEIITFVLVLMIVLLFVGKHFYKYYVLKKILAPFWGKKRKVKTKIILPLKINRLDHLHSVVSSEEVSINDEEISIYWSGNWFRRKLNVEVLLNDNCFYFTSRYIIVNYPNQTVKFNSRLIGDDYESDDREFLFRFDAKNQKATWSGVFPNHPFYGEWEWKSPSL